MWESFIVFLEVWGGLLLACVILAFCLSVYYALWKYGKKALSVENRILFQVLPVIFGFGFTFCYMQVGELLLWSGGGLGIPVSILTLLSGVLLAVACSFALSIRGLKAGVEMKSKVLIAFSYLPIFVLLSSLMAFLAIEWMVLPWSIYVLVFLFIMGRKGLRLFRKREEDMEVKEEAMT